ncbi:ninjurin-B-like [Anopheles cruzii]|uniref:ninjurin-B-like n=1 Tax=Anopheles cruzii TaxID=68878 RepID=UPI0022EC1DF0|nr:ninjurin-B-like [Anopheles cruzii]
MLHLDSGSREKPVEVYSSTGADDDDEFNSVVDSEFEESVYPCRKVSHHASITVEEHTLLHPKPTEKDDEQQKKENASNANNSELTSFVQKKSFAQNMMDIALLSANTNQLRYVLDLGTKHPYYSTSLSLIILSLVMQVAVGLAMLYCNRYNIRKKGEMRRASHLNNLSVAGVFMVTLVNVFISTFNGAHMQSSSIFTNDSTDSSSTTASPVEFVSAVVESGSP